MKRSKKVFLLAGLAFLIPLITLAETKASVDISEATIFNKKESLSGHAKIDFSIVAGPESKKEVDEVFNYSFTEIKKMANAFNGTNPESDLSKISAAAGNEPVTVTPETIALATQAKDIAERTHGAYDPVKGDGTYKDLKIDKKNSTIFLKKAGLSLEFGAIEEGFIADLLIRAAGAANIENAFVQIDGVCRALGRATFGPWTVQIAGSGEKFAKHGRSITINNYSAATVGGDVPAPKINPKTGEPLNSTLYSVTVLSKDAATSQGIANSVFIMGPDAGKSLIDSLGVKAILAFKDGTMKQVGKW